jgi:hemerythrin-like domain-containing protein
MHGTITDRNQKTDLCVHRAGFAPWAAELEIYRRFHRLKTEFLSRFTLRKWRIIMSKPIMPIPFQVDFTKPLDVLFQCHSRIAANLEALRRASETLRNSDECEFTEVFATIDTVLTHFSTAGIKHTQDEEESLFPRMREYRDRVVSDVFEVIGQLEIQHKRAVSIENSLNKMLVNLAADEMPDKNKLDLFCDLSESLYDLYRPHIQMENEFVFPSAGKILTRNELLEVGKEMYQRRQISLTIDH